MEMTTAGTLKRNHDLFADWPTGFVGCPAELGIVLRWEGALQRQWASINAFRAAVEASGGDGTASAVPHNIAVPKSKQIAKQEVRALPLDERIFRLRSILGLNASELASILGIGRSNLYNWLAKPETAIHTRSDARLRILEELSREWESHEVGPLGADFGTPIEIPDGGATTLMSLLGEDLLNRDAITLAFKALKEARKRRKLESERLTSMIRRGYGTSAGADF